jgi:Arc/MetJ-type ribon-helix-helix transcriptional regulator
MTHLKPVHEQLVQEALSSGRYSSVDEFLDEALSAWKKQVNHYSLEKARAAAESIRELRKGNILPEGVTIKDLINEGRA